MNNTGHIRIDRKILDWEWYSDINTCRLWIHLLLKANWKDGRFCGCEIPRGSFPTSYRALSEETGLSVQRVRTALSRLKSTGEITIKQHAKFSVVTIKNYERYQATNTVTNSQLTHVQHTSNTQLTTIEESNKGIREEDNILSGEPSTTSSDQIPYKDIIDYLNAKAGTQYKYSSEDSRRHIRARFNDGFTLADFKVVIDKKVAEWKGTEWEKFLRPATLFNTKFESYLNQRINAERKTGFSNFQQRDYDFDDLEAQLLGAQKGG